MARLPKPPKTDNLKLIKGIGPGFEQRLHRAGIHTFAGLAALSAEKLASLLPGMSARKITKQIWIPQARRLVHDKAKSKTPQKESRISTSRQHYENFTFEFLLDEKNKARRLRVVHVQSGDVDTLAKWDAERFVDFLARHTGSNLSYATSRSINPKLQSTQSDLAGTPLETLTETSLISSESVFRKDSDVPPSLNSKSLPQTAPDDYPATKMMHPQQMIASSMNKLRLVEWKLLLSDTGQSVSKVFTDQAFDVRLTLELSSMDLTSGSHLKSNGTLYARKVSGGQRQMLSEIYSIVPYTKINDLTIGSARLSAGYYRLEALVTLNLVGGEGKRQPGLAAFLEVGFLQVS